MGPSGYRELDPGLPWMGGGIVPRRLAADDARAVLACESPLALGMMLAYARSYAGPLGGVVQGTVAGAVLALTGRRAAAGWAWAGAGAAGLGFVETRRRARQWEAVVESRLGVLAAAAA
ncbi:hypothetical protein [Demequina soli]|uniref:hypothetical protein n=1 Tax=Demequina soli TaxID=1638987 RepID=UPI000783B301|nr:hypothetical protein [Demequina soli]